MPAHIRTLLVLLATVLAALSAAVRAADLSRLPPRAAPSGDPFDPATWTTACIDCVNHLEGLSNRTAALAPDGALHVIYGGEALHHLVYRGGAWSIAAVETAAHPLDMFLSPVMALDGSGRVHAVYVSAVPDRAGATPENLVLRYARQTAAGWQIETLPLAPGYYYRQALALGADGVAHVVATTSSGLFYTHRAAGGWTAPTLLDEYGGIPALALDGDNRPAACYQVHTPPYGFAVARFDGAAWRFDEIPGGTFDDTGCDLAFAADGRLRLVALVDDGLRYFRRDDAGWTNEMVLSTTLLDRPGQAPSLRFDPDGRPVIAFHTVFDAEEYDYRDPVSWLQIATRTLTGWQLETADDRPDAREATLLFDGDAPYIVYRDRLGLALAERRGGSWQSTRLDRSGAFGFRTGYGPSLAFHGFEMRAAAYDAQNDAVFYAAGGPERWAVELVDQRPEQERSAQPSMGLALGPDGAPHIVYEFADESVSFTHAYRSGPFWNRDALPGSGCGPYAIATDRAGRAYLTQYDCPGLGLSFIPWPLPPLHNGVYEAVDRLAAHNPLTVVADGAGRFHLAYTVGQQIRYAVRETDGRWNTSLIFDLPHFGATGVDLALDAGGRPVVVFNYEGIIVASPGAPGEGWTLDEGLRAEQIIDSGPEIEVDGQGALHVVYYRGAQGALVYARHDAGGWRTTTLSGSGQHSLALDPFGNPAVAYVDLATEDAMVTYVPANVRATAFLPAVSR